MAVYKLLADHVLGGSVVPAGTTITMPDDWQPSGAVEPIDSVAIQKFWDAGPVPCPLVRAQWSTQVVAAPKIFWKRYDANSWVLTGAGEALGPKAESGAMSLP
jgi:hypothetical protein